MESNQSMHETRAVQPLGAADSPHAPAPVADAAELRDALEDVFESVEVLLRRANGFLAQYAEAQPQLLVAGAASLGFVLGGGLASRTGTLLARTGGRMLLAHWLQRLTHERSDGTRSHATATRATGPDFK